MGHILLTHIPWVCHRRAQLPGTRDKGGGEESGGGGGGLREVKAEVRGLLYVHRPEACEAVHDERDRKGNRRDNQLADNS